MKIDFSPIFVSNAHQQGTLCPMASLIAQKVRNLPAMQETRAWSLGWEDLLEKGTVTHSSILAWRIPWMRGLAGYGPWSHKELDMTEWLTVSLSRTKVKENLFMIALNVCMKKIYICYFSLCFTGQKKRNGHTLKDKEAQKFNSIKHPEGHQIYLQKFIYSMTTMFKKISPVLLHYIHSTNLYSKLRECSLPQEVLRF